MDSARQVVTVIVKKDDRILIMRRSSKVDSFQGYWAGVSGSIQENETPLQAAVRELREETGIKAAESEFISAERPVMATNGKNVWEVHPFLLNVDDEIVSLDWEHDAYEWIRPDELYKYEFVPKLDEVVNSLLRIEKRGIHPASKGD
jgi:8-oxo-dGTP pyrophosphatase MutT (NUDIX family)